MPTLAKYTRRGVSTRASQKAVEDKICAHLRGLCEMGRRLIDYDLLLHSKMINFIEKIKRNKSAGRGLNSQIASPSCLNFTITSIQSDRIYYHNNENKTVLQEAYY